MFPKKRIDFMPSGLVTLIMGSGFLVNGMVGHRKGYLILGCSFLLLGFGIVGHALRRDPA